MKKSTVILLLLHVMSLLANLATGAYTCKAPNTFGCDNCGTLVICQGTTANPTRYPVNCGSSKVCVKSSDTQAGCKPLNDGGECKCTDSPSLQKDPFDIKYFIMCLSNTAQFSVKCEEGKAFDEIKGKCIATTAVNPPTCTETGFSSNDPSCKTYYGCYYDQSNVLTPTEIFSCVEPNLFDGSECVPEADLIPNAFACPPAEDGGFVDTVECNKFHTCSAGAETGDPLCCPKGELFDANRMRCFPAAQVDKSLCPQISPCADTSALEKTCEDNTLSSLFPGLTTFAPGVLCSKDGPVPYPGDCTKYYWCSSGRYTIQFCPPKLLFDKTKGYCTLPSDFSGC
ncbi:hypothetical protein SK128_003676 [Halocaridina rubra]|uniref:Chitin-binding type-2 domain-containing protein n=1 Tax=Halocaridina rubra TaxID=373956 RepID=A0AAN8XIU1_HALRR